MQARLFFTLLFSIANRLVFSQAVDNTTASRAVPTDKYWRFHYDNDFFTATDQYYSQGVCLEIAHPGLARSPLSLPLLKSGSSVQYGMSMTHDVYTPSSIRHPEIIVGDRPFAADWLLSSFAISTDSVRHSRLTSAFSMGVVGTAAGGADMQTSIHRWLNNIEPLGWKNQVRTDVAISYLLQYEKQFFYNGCLAVSGIALLRAGTLNDKAGLGLSVMTGYFESPFKREAAAKNFRFYFYGQPLLGLVAYDATLQGGMFNRTSPYTISAGQMERLTLQLNYGAVFRVRHLYLEYSRAFLSPEFKTGTSHQWGGVGIGCTF